jgi:hypothetical protein
MGMHAIWTAVALSLASATPPQPTGMASLVGLYKITSGGTGTVEIRPALGGSFHEVRVLFTDVPHELRYLVATAAVSGTHSVWRFEEDPAPAVKNEGTARFEGGELIAVFPHKADNPSQIFREHWRVAAASGQLDYVLEASSEGKKLRRVGGFTAARQ